MYTRPHNTRFASAVRIPAHYSGNAFAADDEPAVPNPQASEAPPQTYAPPAPKAESDSSTETSIRPQTPKFGLSLRGLFSGGIGSEELLILGMILLLLGNEGTDDLVLLLLLLLFIP